MIGFVRIIRIEGRLTFLWGIAMLIEFRVGNFRSFREEQVLSMVAAGRDRTLADNLIPCGTFELLKAAALYGANASGKSNLVKAFEVMRRFVVTSATGMNVGERIPGMTPFRLANSGLLQEACSFELEVLLDGSRYQYGFTAGETRVHEEWLTAYPPPHFRAQRWLERTVDRQTGTANWTCRGPLKGQEELLRERTRDNGLALSCGAQLNVPDLKGLYLWFRGRLWVFDLSLPPRGLIQQTARYISKNPERRDGVITLVKHADLGVRDIALSERTLKVEDLTPEVLDTLSQQQIRSLKKGPADFMDIRSVHSRMDDELVEFDFEEESNGTQRFFALAGPFTDALSEGAVVVVDELECSMHPLLTRKLIELFQSPSVNDKGAQLIFATHDTTLMDRALLRRDQICLVEKDNGGASELFSLYDFETKKRPRTDGAFARSYLAGRFGAVPRFGPTLEDAELK